MGYPDSEAHGSGNVTTFSKSHVEGFVRALGFTLADVESVHLFYDEARVYTYDRDDAGRIVIERDPQRSGYDKARLRYSVVRYVSEHTLTPEGENAEESKEVIDSPTDVL